MPTKSNDRSDSAPKPRRFTPGAVNFILQSKAFRVKAAQDRLKSTIRDVYQALFHIWNDCGWLPEFTATYGRVMSDTGIGSDNTYYSALKVLVDLGYMDYTPGPNQYQAATFRLFVLYDQEAPENPNDGERKDAPAQSGQPAQSNQQILPPASEFEGLHPDMLHNWKVWSQWVDREPHLADLRRFKKPLTPRDFDKLLSEHKYETIQIKCEEIAATFDPNAAGAPVSLYLKLKQYLRMHKELDY